jgi:photosystem II stability/assembly factor-like uncharacterized protein
VILAQPPPDAVAFADLHHGWVGDAHGLFATIDGRRFRLAVRAPIVAVDAVDPQHAWAITRGGDLFATTNGTGWSRRGRPRLVSVRLVDVRHGFGLTRSGTLVRSRDGGRSWLRVHTPLRMQAQCFSSLRDGWVARPGSVWTTHDGGARWARVRLALPPNLGPQTQTVLECRGRSVWALFADGVAAGSQGYEVFRSLDGGSTWHAILAGLVSTRLPRISNYPGPFVALGGGRAVFEGSCPACVLGHGSITFVSTLDGGRSFTRATPFVRSFFAGPISFIDPKRGWLLTQPFQSKSRTLLFTRDGGRHWRRVATLRGPAAP